MNSNKMAIVEINGHENICNKLGVVGKGLSHAQLGMRLSLYSVIKWQHHSWQCVTKDRNVSIVGPPTFCFHISTMIWLFTPIHAENKQLILFPKP